MDVRVDDARDRMKARSVHPLAGRMPEVGADGHDPAVVDPDVRADDALGRHHAAAVDEKVDGIRS